MSHTEGELSLSELVNKGITIITEGDFKTGQKIDFILKDGTEVEAKIGGLLVDGSYLLSYKIGDQELGRKISLKELENLNK